MTKVLSLLNESNIATKKPSAEPRVRSPRWKFDNIDWGKSLNNNIFHKVYLGSLTMLFPEGERFFVRAVKQHVDKIDDKQLLKDVKAFIGQEVQHGRLHEIANKKVLGKDYEIDGFLNQWTGFAFGFLEKLANRFLPESYPVAVTAAAEHFTAAWASNALESDIFQNIEEDEIRDLINWHAIEEIEHKHVAFDVMRQVDDSYETRAVTMVITAVLIGALSIWGAIYLLRQEKNIDWRQFFSTLLDESTSEKGMFRLYVEAFFGYFKPGFHPSQVDDYKLAQKVAAELEKKLQEQKATA